MSDYKVTFVGLICHIGPTADGRNKTHAALINDPGVHIPVVWITGMPPRTLVKGDVVSFDIGDGTAATDVDFESCVPHLSAVSDGTILNDVLGAIPTNSVVAYVKYPTGSTLTVDQYYPLQATFTLNSTTTPEGCVARVTALTFSSDSQVKLLINGKGYALLNPNGSEANEISNASTGGDHFMTNRNLLTAGAHIAVVTETKLCPQAKIGPHIEVSTQVECTNTQWP